MRVSLEGRGSSQTILLARRGRTIRMCSLDARSEGQPGYSLLKGNEQAWRDHLFMCGWGIDQTALRKVQYHHLRWGGIRGEH